MVFTFFARAAHPGAVNSSGYGPCPLMPRHRLAGTLVIDHEDAAVIDPLKMFLAFCV